MSRGQKPRTPEHFPHMRWRARKRYTQRFTHYRQRYILAAAWDAPGRDGWIPFAEIMERGM